MLTPSKINQLYFGPKMVGRFQWEWEQKRMGRQHVKYLLTYSPDQRRFTLQQCLFPALGAIDVEQVSDDAVVLAFRSLLSPEQLAQCLAASLGSSA